MLVRLQARGTNAFVCQLSLRDNKRYFAACVAAFVGKSRSVSPRVSARGELSDLTVFAKISKIDCIQKEEEREGAITMIDYRSSNGENGVGYLRNVFSLYQIDCLEEVDVGHSVLHAGFLKSGN